MSGWFNQRMGYTYINLEAYERNVANVKTWCGTNPGEAGYDWTPACNSAIGDAMKTMSI
jgi:hypothetical protein